MKVDLALSIWLNINTVRFVWFYKFFEINLNSSGLSFNIAIAKPIYNKLLKLVCRLPTLFLVIFLVEDDNTLFFSSLFIALNKSLFFEIYIKNK